MDPFLVFSSSVLEAPRFLLFFFFFFGESPISYFIIYYWLLDLIIDMNILKHLGYVWEPRLRFFFFFFFPRVLRLVATVHALCMNSSRKFYFSVTFSLKMGPTVLFIHLKIILLQYFSVSIFSFQLYLNGPLMV